MTISNSYADMLKRIEDQRIQAADSAKEQFTNIILSMRNMNINFVQVEFDGSGDSGSISNIEVLPNANSSSDFEMTVENWAYEFLEGTGVDWYNNEGGFGEIIIDLDENKLNYEVNQRVESYELAAGGSEDINE